MDESIVKAAYKEAEDSLKEKQVEEVKKIVLRTLDKIESLRKEKDTAQDRVKEIDDKIKILKMDIDDLKEGRLDRIEERQSKDEKAKNVSVVIIIKETRVEREYPYWYWPYRVIWHDTPIYNPPIYYTTASNDVSSFTTCGGNSGYYTVCPSNAKWGVTGTYTLSSGNTVNLR